MKDLNIFKIQESLDFSSNITLLDTVNSTNTYLMEKGLEGMDDDLCIVIARHQTKGYGRNKSKWISDFNAGIWMSIGTVIRKKSNISPLTLAISAGLAEAFHSKGFTEIGLKWPNDFVCGKKKLGGILIETQPTDRHCLKITIGIGINIELPNSLSEIEVTGLTPTSLHSIKGESFDVSVLIANLITSTHKTIKLFECSGLDPFLDLWRRYDIYNGWNINVVTNNQEISGINDGIDDQGALVVTNQIGDHSIMSGSIVHIGAERDQ